MTLGTYVVFSFMKGFQPVVGYNYDAKNYVRLVESIQVSLKYLGVLVGVVGAGESDAGLWHAVMAMFPGAVAAFSFLLFNLLDSLCLAAISTIAKEMNSRKWTTFAIVYQNVFAYCVTFMVYQFGCLYMGARFGAGSAAALVILCVMLYMLFRPATKQQTGQKHRTVNDLETSSGNLN